MVLLRFGVKERNAGLRVMDYRKKNKDGNIYDEQMFKKKKQQREIRVEKVQFEHQHGDCKVVSEGS